MPQNKLKFIIFTFIFSLPLFFFLLFYEIFLQTTLIEILEFVQKQPGYFNYSWTYLLHIFIITSQNFSSKLIKLVFLHLGPLHLLEFCTRTMILNLASKIYLEDDKSQTSLKQIFFKWVFKSRLKGSFVTTIYVLGLSTCASVGLIWSIAVYYILMRNLAYNLLCRVLYRVVCMFFLGKYFEWSAVWNMGTVISSLEDVFGSDALGFSACLVRGKEVTGIVLELFFFVWRYGLRMLCVYFGLYRRASSIFVLIGLFCLGSVIKWFVYMVYFYRLKESRELEFKM